MTPIERNKNGHIVIAFNGLDLSGEIESARLKRAGYRVDESAESSFMRSGPDGYDKRHRLISGHAYRVALVPGSEVVQGKRRTTKYLRDLRHEYGYGVPLGGHIPPVCEYISSEWMEEMKLLYIASLHDPIISVCGCNCVLSVSCSETGLVVGTYCGGLDDQWDDLGAFVFPDLNPM